MLHSSQVMPPVRVRRHNPMRQDRRADRSSEEPSARTDEYTEEEPSSGPPHKSGRSRFSRSPYVVLGAALVAVLVLSSAWMMSGTTRSEVVIVAILPLSGASSYLVEMGDAMNLTAERLNKWGGLNGMHIRLVVLDCASSPDIAYSKLVEAEEEYHPLAVVTATRAAAVLMAEYAEEKNIVLISVGSSPESLTEGKDWIFRYYMTSAEEAGTAFSTIDSLGVSSLGILYLNDSYGTPTMSLLAQSHESSGGTVESVGFLPNATDFSDEVASIVDNDAVFVVALRHQFPSILSELNSSGYSGHVVCAVEASIPAMWPEPELQGVFVNAPVLYNPAASIDVGFLSEFEERYGEELTHQGAIGSDVLRLIWGLLSDNEVSRENLRYMLDKGFVSSGIMGVVVLEPGSRNVDIPLYRGVIEGGELRYL